MTITQKEGVRHDTLATVHMGRRVDSPSRLGRLNRRPRVQHKGLSPNKIADTTNLAKNAPLRYALILGYRGTGLSMATRIEIQANDELFAEVVADLEHTTLYSSRNALWTAVIAAFASRGKRITTTSCSRCAERLERTGRIALKTRRDNRGRKKRIGAGEIRRKVAEIQKCAIADEWAATDDRWRKLNMLRNSVGQSSVAPIDKPTNKHFRSV